MARAQAPWKPHVVQPRTDLRYATIEDLMYAAYLAGFRGEDLVTAVAIALAESRGDVYATGDTKLANATWGPSVGPWQIRTLNAQIGKGTTRDITRLYDLWANARAAYDLYRARRARGGTGFEDWTTWRRGAWKAFVPQVSRVAAEKLPGIARRAEQVSLRMRTGGAGPQVSLQRSPAVPYSGARAGASPEVLGTPSEIEISQAAGAYGPAGGDTESVLAHKRAAAAGGPSGALPPLGPGGAPSQAPSGAAEAALAGAAGGGGAPSEPFPDPADRQAVYDYVKRNYGALAALLDDPGLYDIIVRYARGELSDQQFQAAVVSSDWWRSHSAAQRDFWVLRRTDPAEAERRLVDRATSIRLAASRLGVSMTPERARQLGEQSLTLGMTDAEINAALLNEVDWNAPRGTVAATQASIQAKAAQWMVPVSDAQLDDWARRILEGSLDEAGLDAALRDLAVGRFPQLRDHIAAGIKPADFFAPYVQVLSQELERPLDVADLMGDPRLQRVTGFWDAGSKVQRPMTLSEAQAYARSLPEWRFTSRARVLAGEATDVLVSAFTGRSA
jgi:hypothetical protein